MEPTVTLGQTDLVSIETYKGSMLEEARVLLDTKRLKPVTYGPGS